MSSTAKGTKFEKIIYNLIQSQISVGQFWAREDCCKVFLQKGYYSPDRQSEIYFDVAVEIYLPGSKEFSMLVLIECKDYTSAIPVNDIEEFYAKVAQVSGLNVKGVFASTAQLQSGALKYAISKKIGVLRYFSAGEFRWDLKRSPAIYPSKRGWQQSSVIHQALLSDNFTSHYFDCYFAIGQLHTNSLNDAFQQLILECSMLSPIEVAKIRNPSLSEYRFVPYVKKEVIDDLAVTCLENISYKNGQVNLEALCEREKIETGLKISIVPNQGRYAGMLGEISFDKNMITVVEQQPKFLGRFRFTLAHELGHFYLGHQAYMNRELIGLEEVEGYSSKKRWLQNEDVLRLERQANYFAASLLLPLDSFLSEFFQLVDQFGIKDKGFGLIYVDEQPSNLRTYFEVTKELMAEFGVSRQAVHIRLARLGFLRDVRQEKLKHASQYTLF